MRRHGAWMAVVLCLGCGAGSDDAPPMESNTGNGQAGPCGTTQGLRDAVRGTATREDLQPLLDLMRERLVDTGKWRQTVRVALTVMRAEPPVGLAASLGALRDGQGLARLTPHLRAVLGYFVGTLPLLPEEAFAQGPHLGPVRVVTSALRVCDPNAVWMTVNRLLTLRLPCTGCPGGSRLFAAALADALAALLEDPELGGVLDTLEFAEVSGGPRVVGRAGFQLFADLIVDGIASPSFTQEYYNQNLRVIIQDVLGRRLSDGAQQKLNALLDALGEGLQPELGLLEPLQKTVGCIRRQDANHEVAGMVFDWIRLDSLEWRDFVAAIAPVFETGEGVALNQYLGRVTRLLASDDTLARDALGSVLPLLVDGADARLLGAVDGLRGHGVARGVLDAAVLLLGRCGQDDVP